MFFKSRVSVTYVLGESIFTFQSHTSALDNITASAFLKKLEEQQYYFTFSLYCTQNLLFKQ